MTDDTEEVEAVTAADVRAAEKEADEAQRLVATLEDHVIAGDTSITAGDIADQARLSRFARLRLEATRRKAERYRVVARLNAANQLREQIESYATGSGKRFAKLLTAVQDAEKTFLAAVQEHDDKVLAWVQDLRDLRIPESNGSPVAPAEDGRLALARDGLKAGRRTLTTVTGAAILANYRQSSDPDAVIADLLTVDAEAANPTAQHFYRGPGGSVIAKDEPFSREEIKRLDLIQLTRKEAWGE